MLSKIATYCIIRLRLLRKWVILMTEKIHKGKKGKMLLDRILKSTLTIIMVFSLMFSTSIVVASGDSVKDIVNDINSGDGVFAIIRNIIGILAWAGFAIAMFKLMQIGILFMMGAGKSRSDAKASLYPWIAGALVCLLFGTVGPWIINIIVGENSSGVFDI